jgi:hypothetical protein
MCSLLDVTDGVTKNSVSHTSCADITFDISVPPLIHVYLQLAQRTASKPATLVQLTLAQPPAVGKNVSFGDKFHRLERRSFGDRVLVFDLEKGIKI